MRPQVNAAPARTAAGLFITSTAIALVMLAGTSLLNAQVWTTLPGAAMDIGADAKGDVWVIGTNSVAGGYTIWRWDPGSNNWKNAPGGAVRISVDTDGTAWIVNNTGSVFHSDANNQWSSQKCCASDIGVGANGDLWIIGTNRTGNDYDIYKAVFAPGTRNIASWQKVPGGAVRIAVGPDGVPWVVNSSGNIFQWQTRAGNWQIVNGGAKDVTVGADGTVYVIGDSPNVSGGFGVYQWQGNNQWKQLNGGGLNIAAGPAGTLYVTQDQSTQYAILSNSGQPGPNAAPSTQAGLQAFNFCWKNSNPANLPLSTNSSDCGTGYAKDPTGLMCYPTCKAGYKIVGPVCWQECPAGFNDTGADCGKPSSYGRGAGYAIWDQGKCNNENSQGCEQNGAMWYPKCQANFHAVGCCTCSPDCPSGMPDVGAMCQKNSYGNGAGRALGCPPGTTQQGLLCYKGCTSNQDEVAGVCWDRCPTGWVQCGAGCASSPSTCAAAVQDQVMSVLTAAATIASEVLTAGAAAGAVEGAKVGTMTSEDAVKSATKMVNKLDLKGALQQFPKQGITKANMSEIIGNSAKKTLLPTSKIGVAQTAARAGEDGATMIESLVGIANDPGLTDDQKNFDIAQAVLSTSALLDPTGIMGVVSAYTKPLCSLAATPTKSASVVDFDAIDRQEVSTELMGNR